MEFQDKLLKCVDCGTDFVFTAGEQLFFYDKQFWAEYLDFLAANRFNTLYLWNGHPFASLVKLADYPYAVEVPDDVFARNVEMFRYITTEADRRAIIAIVHETKPDRPEYWRE